MAISKERLDEVIKNNEIIYAIIDYDRYPNPTERKVKAIHGCNIEDIISFHYLTLDDLYETQAEAEWHKKNDRERTEYFCPPMEFSSDTINIYYFIGADGKKYNIAANLEKTRFSVEDEYFAMAHFDTYPEAVAYARKLFKGEA